MVIDIEFKMLHGGVNDILLGSGLLKNGGMTGTIVTSKNFDMTHWRINIIRFHPGGSDLIANIRWPRS